MGNISEYDMYLFGAGVHYDMYMKLGAHPCKKGRWQGVNFAVWAPNAKRVWVIGSFNDWNETSHEMKRLEPNGIYELFVSNVKIGDMYKYLIETQDGRKLYKADPYANYAEMRPGTASKVADISKLKWSDEKWMMRYTVSRCPFMRYIRVLGNVMRVMMKTPDSIHTVNWQWN